MRRPQWHWGHSLKVSRERLFGSGGYLLASLVEPQPSRQTPSKGDVDFIVCSSMEGLRGRTDQAARNTLGKESRSSLVPGTINTGSLQSSLLLHKHHVSK